MGQLSQALSGFDKDLGKFLEHRMERKLEEDAAAASAFIAENPGSTQNLEDFRKFCLEDPERLNLSPYVKKAIEGEIIKGNALQFASELEDAYNTSPMKNERDPEKVKQWSEEFRKDFMQRKGLDKHQDRIFMARHFTHPSLRLVGGLLDKHNKDVESQNAAMLEQQMFQNVDTMLAGRQNISTAGGFDTKVPAERRAYIQTAAAPIIMEQVEKMKALGYPQARIVGLMEKMVLSGKHNARTARQLAESLHVEVNGQKVSLMSQPGISKAIDQMSEAETDRAWQAETRAHTRLQWQREESARTALNKGYEYGSQGNADLSRDTVVNKLGLCSADDYPRFKAAAEDGQKGQFKSLYSSPELTTAALSLESDLKQGKAGKAEVMDLARSGYDPAQVQRLLSLADANTTTEGQAVLAAQSNIAKTYISMIGNVSAEEAAQAYSSYQNGGVKPTAGALTQVMQDLPEVNTAFADYVEEKRREKQEKAGPAQKDAPLSSLELQRIVQEFQGQYLDKKIKSTKERYNAEKTQRTDSQAVQGYLMNPKTVGPISAEKSGSFFSRGPDPARASVFQGAVSNLNTLFADSITQDPAHAQNISNLKTLQDVLKYANSATEGGLTWQEAYYITTGQTPAERGITNVRAAQADLYKWFTTERGIKVKAPASSSDGKGKAPVTASAPKFTRKKEVR